MIFLGFKLNHGANIVDFFVELKRNQNLRKKLENSKGLTLYDLRLCC